VARCFSTGSCSELSAAGYKQLVSDRKRPDSTPAQRLARSPRAPTPPRSESELHRQLARERARNAGLEGGLAVLSHRLEALREENARLRRAIAGSDGDRFDLELLSDGTPPHVAGTVVPWPGSPGTAA
jgi:hypothetical protein